IWHEVCSSLSRYFSGDFVDHSFPIEFDPRNYTKRYEREAQLSVPLKIKPRRNDRLKHEPQTVLHLAAVVSHQLRRDLSEVGVIEINYRIGKLHPIENVVGFPAHFELKAFG